MSEVFKHLGPGQQPSTSEYNRLADAVEGLLRFTGMQYFRDSRGVHVRRTPVASTGFQLFKITVVGSWGKYTCKRYSIDATYWGSGSGQTKLAQVSNDGYEIFNIAEDATTVSNALTTADFLLGRRITDDEGNVRWIGFSPKFAWWDV